MAVRTVYVVCVFLISADRRLTLYYRSWFGQSWPPWTNNGNRGWIL